MFIDSTRLHLKAGNGGNGCVAFHREKYVAAGGPVGGDGGKGGDVVFLVDKNLNTLESLRYTHTLSARNGEDGKGEKMYGKSAEDLVIKVPLGTLIKDAESGQVIKDMSDEEPYILCKGGRGGWGNRHFATPTRQCPRFARPGIPGEEKEVILEMKLIADVGLIGFPNVGKSTLLSVVSAARPKISNYHFTTLIPNLGVVPVDREQSFVMADIPGLIEGASDGAGLGHDFLRHIERCRLLVHLVDVSGEEGREPIEDFEIINKELARFSPELAKRPQIVVANKIDASIEEQIDELKTYVEEKGYPFYAISAAAHLGTRELVMAIWNAVQALPPIKVYETEYVEPESLIDPRDHSVRISRLDGSYWAVEGEWLLRIMRGINFGEYESLQYFQRILQNEGVIKELVKAGVKEGDTVDIYGFEFDFVY
ncbi:MAG: GTPase ObgE [Clostridia bacterium]|nr:GTPase ObgE [Clostridia bacterium]MBQ5820892.1 GTPase ObgE [Clostridia bacterium]